MSIPHCPQRLINEEVSIALDLADFHEKGRMPDESVGYLEQLTTIMDAIRFINAARGRQKAAMIQDRE